MKGATKRRQTAHPGGGGAKAGRGKASRRHEFGCKWVAAGSSYDDG
jgi:hypothetical protein